MLSAPSKAALRREMQARREALTAAERARAAAAFTRNALEYFATSLRGAEGDEAISEINGGDCRVGPDGPPRNDGFIVAGYWPLRGELDVRPLLAALHERGIPVCLPVIPVAERILTFHCWQPETPLAKGPLGVMQPPVDAPICTPDILLVPLLAFDAAGHRLGYGGGYYDATLAQLRSANPHLKAIGCAYAFQQVPALPADPHDMPLDAVIAV